MTVSPCQYLDLALNISNYCFTAIFLCEVALKIYAVGLSRYFTDKYLVLISKLNIYWKNYFFSLRWNQLDVGIAVLSVIGIGLEEVEGQVAELP